MKILKRYQGLSGEERLRKQTADLRSGKVKMVTFYFDEEKYEEAKKNPYFCKEAEEFHEQNNFRIGLVSLNRVFLTEKLENPTALERLEEKYYEMFKNCEYIRINKDIVHGAMPEFLIKAHHLYMKHRKAIDEFERDARWAKKQEKEKTARA